MQLRKHYFHIHHTGLWQVIGELMLPMQKSQQSIVMLAAAVAPTHRGSICIPSGVELHSTVLAAQPRLIEHLYF